MSLRFLNTLSGQKEEFVPLEPGRVRMYTCGPTVYNFAHIGNYRTFVFQDVLRRYLKYKGYQLLHVMNITDVDDKIIRDSQAAGLSLRDFTDKYAAAFLEDLASLRVETPEYVARATEHIPEMVALIERLEARGLTYRSDGSIYFRIAAFPGYGKIARLDLDGNRAGARVEVDEYEKENPSDFALWKAPKPGEPQWETEIGPGRPGGTSNVRRWRCVTWAKVSIFTPAARISCFRITPTKSRNRRAPRGNASSNIGCTAST